MSSMRLLDLIGTIDDDLINEALEYKGNADVKAVVTPVDKSRTRTVIIRLIAAAACIILVGGVIFMLPKNKSSESAKSADNHNAGTREVLSVIAGDAEETVAGLDSECADEVEAIDRDEVAGENIYNDDTVKKNEDWAIMEPATNAVSLKVDSVADGKINVSFVLSDGDYQSEFFTYDGLFQLVKDDENITVTPPAALSEDDVMIPLDEITTEFVFDYESKYGPLEPGEYTLIGYIYSSKSSPAIPISTTVTIPET